MKIREYQSVVDDLKPYFEKMERETLHLMKGIEPYKALEKYSEIFGVERDRKHKTGKRHKLTLASIVGKQLAFDKHMLESFPASVAYAITLLLSKKDLVLPLNSQMAKLLEIADLEPEEIQKLMLKYKMSFPIAHPAPEKGSIVYFMTKVIHDALVSRNYETLNNVNDYLLSEGLITEDLVHFEPVWEKFAFTEIEDNLKIMILNSLKMEMILVAEEKMSEINEIREILLKSKDSFECSIMRSKDGETFHEVSRNVLDMIMEMENQLQMLAELAMKRMEAEHYDIFSETENLMKRDTRPYDIARGYYSALLDGDETIFMPIMNLGLVRLFANSPITASPFEINAKVRELIGEGKKEKIRIYDENDYMEVDVDVPLGKDVQTVPYTFPITAVLSDISKFAMEDSLYIRNSVISFFRKYGMSERRARDLAIVVAVRQSRAENFDMNSKVPMILNLYPEPVEDKEKDNGCNKENENLRRKIEELEKKLKDAEKEKKAYRHEISTLEKKIDDENDKHDKFIEELLKENEKEDCLSGKTESEIHYPYHTDKRITLYGGFDVFHKEMRKLLPEIKIVEPCYKAPNLDTFRKSDMVFIQTNKLNHGNYFAVRDASKNANVPYYHLRYACAKKCADFIVGEIEHQKTME